MHPVFSSFTIANIVPVMNGQANYSRFHDDPASRASPPPPPRETQCHDHFTTRTIHVGSEPDAATGAVVPLLSVATTFKQDGIGKHRVGIDMNPSESLPCQRSVIELKLML